MKVYRVYLGFRVHRGFIGLRVEGLEGLGFRVHRGFIGLGVEGL